MDCSHIDDVAAQVLTRFASSPVERVTILMCSNEQIVMGEPQSGDHRSTTGVQFVIEGKVIAIVHNHPGSDRLSLVFSPVDREMARRYRIPSYIVNSALKMRKFDPRTNDTTAFARGN